MDFSALIKKGCLPAILELFPTIKREFPRTVKRAGFCSTIKKALHATKSNLYRESLPLAFSNLYRRISWTFPP